MNILITIPEGSIKEMLIPPRLVQRFEKLGDVTWNQEASQFTSKELRTSLQDAHVCVTGWGCPQLTEAVLIDANKLELVTHIGGSIAPIASDALYEKGIRISSANSVMAQYVAEATLTYILTKLRDVGRFDEEIKNGEWNSDWNRVQTLIDKQVGLIGLGTVGHYLIEFLAPFDVSVSVYDPYVATETINDYETVEFTELETVLRQSEIVSIHASKTPETIHLLGKDELQLLPEGCLLVNTARGAVIDQQALVSELRSKRLSAVLDVFEEEPLPEESDLRELDNVILLPHVAGAPTKHRMTKAMLEEIKRYKNDNPLQHNIEHKRFETMTDDRIDTNTSDI